MGIERSRKEKPADAEFLPDDFEAQRDYTSQILDSVTDASVAGKSGPEIAAMIERMCTAGEESGVFTDDDTTLAVLRDLGQAYQGEVSVEEGVQRLTQSLGELFDDQAGEAEL